MPRPDEDLTVAVTDGERYWHIAALRLSPEILVFGSREPGVNDHWTYHKSGVVHRKRGGTETEVRRGSPLPVNGLEPFVLRQQLDLSSFETRETVRPGKRAVVIHRSELATDQVFVTVYALPVADTEAAVESLRVASAEAGVGGFFVLLRDANPWALLAFSAA